MSCAINNGNKHFIINFFQPIKITGNNISWFEQDKAVFKGILKITHRREYHRLDSLCIANTVRNIFILFFNDFFLLHNSPCQTLPLPMVVHRSR